MNGLFDPLEVAVHGAKRRRQHLQVTHERVGVLVEEWTELGGETAQLVDRADDLALLLGEEHHDVREALQRPPDLLVARRQRGVERAELGHEPVEVAAGSVEHLDRLGALIDQVVQPLSLAFQRLGGRVDQLREHLLVQRLGE